MARLRPDTLGQAAAEVILPAYDFSSRGCGIVHLGLGAFHRAHQAVYTERAMVADGGNWGIIGVSLRSANVAGQLRPQQGLYSVLSEDGNNSELQVIGAIRRTLVAVEQAQEIVAAIADPAIRIISLTITEKGYCLAADGRSLAMDNEQVVADLAAPGQPRSALGFLALGLKQRMRGQGGPLTIISCDNLSANSQLLRGVLRQYLQHSFVEVLPWLESAVSFPCSMVDRIVPAMTSEARQRQAQMLGLDDAAAVTTEGFSQWVIENDFAAGRPAWEQVGVQLVDDIQPYEDIKLGLLNASHSAIAWLGRLAQLQTVDQVVADETINAYLRRLMQLELMPVLAAPAGFDLDAYGQQLLARFANPGLAHRCEQIAMDSSEKLPQRWLPALNAHRPAPLLTRALAAWCWMVLNSDCLLQDPRAEQLLALRQSSRPMAQRLAELLRCARISADTVSDFSRLLTQVEQSIDNIEQGGLVRLLAA